MNEVNSGSNSVATRLKKKKVRINLFIYLKHILTAVCELPAHLLL